MLARGETIHPTKEAVTGDEAAEQRINALGWLLAHIRSGS